MGYVAAEVDTSKSYMTFLCWLELPPHQQPRKKALQFLRLREFKKAFQMANQFFSFLETQLLFGI